MQNLIKSITLIISTLLFHPEIAHAQIKKNGAPKEDEPHPNAVKILVKDTTSPQKAPLSHSSSSNPNHFVKDTTPLQKVPPSHSNPSKSNLPQTTLPVATVPPTKKDTIISPVPQTSLKVDSVEAKQARTNPKNGNDSIVASAVVKQTPPPLRSFIFQPLDPSRSPKELNERFFIPPDADNHAIEVQYGEHFYDAYIVHLANNEVRFFWKDAQQKIYYNFERLKQNLVRHDLQLLFATNAGMFSPNNSPQGLFVDSLKQLVPIRRDTTGYGNFYMQPNGIFLIDTLKKPHVITTQQYGEYEKKTLYATQSGPMLVIDNQINKLFKKGSANTYIRNGVGLIDEHRVVFIISKQPVNFYEFASVFQDLFECKQALYLDGAISKTYLPVLNQKSTDGHFGPMIGTVKPLSKK